MLISGVCRRKDYDHNYGNRLIVLTMEDLFVLMQSNVKP